MNNRKWDSLLPVVLCLLLSIVFLPSIVSAGTFRIQGAAYSNPDGTYTLTDWYGEAGLISYSDALNSGNGFDISFRFIISEGCEFDDADGMAAVFSPSMGIVGGGGPEFGAPSGNDIYVVEMDTFFGDDTHDAPGDPEYMHIGITKGSFDNHIIYKRCGALTDRKWHTLRITYSAKIMTIFLDGNKYLSQTLSLPGKCYFSISGGTGDYYSVQEVREISVKQMNLQGGNIADSTVTLPSAEYTCTGNAISPVPTVKLNGKTLKKGTDYTVTYSNNVYPGSASVVIKGKGSYSGTKTVHFQITGQLPAPSGLKVQLTAYNKAALSWNRVSGAKSYHIYRKAGNGKYKKIRNTSSLSFTNSLLTAGKVYTYYVKAVDNNGKEGKSSKTSSVTTIGTVTGISLSGRGLSKVLLAWNKAVGASGYEASMTPKLSTKAVTKNTSMLSIELAASPGKTYSFKVRAYQNAGGKKVYGKWSSGKTFTFNPYSGRTANSDSSRRVYTVKTCVDYEKKYMALEDYSDEFFTSSVLDSGRLIKISALAAASTYGKSTEGFLRQCGFTNISSSYTGKNNSGTLDDNDHCTVYTGSKTFQYRNSDGTTGSKPIIAVIVNGYSGDGYEWRSNFNMGKSSTHAGFNTAAGEAYSLLKKKYGSRLSNSIVWITGHSRGAAVTNLLAYRISKDYTDPVKTEIFAYGFATPNVSKLSSKTSSKLRVINIVNKGDFVPYVPLEAWGFDKAGKTKTFAVNTAVKENYKKYTGEKLNSMSESGREKLISQFNLCCFKSQDGYYIFRPKTSATPGPIRAYDYMRNGLALVMNKSGAQIAKGAAYMALYANDVQYNALTATFVLGGKINPKIMEAHLMMTYLAYADTLAD